MLSEESSRLLVELKAMPDGKLCTACAAVRLAVSRWDVLKSIRELITQGEVACELSVCSFCGKRELVTFVRPRAFTRRAPKKARILVVDDVADIRMLYATILEQHGFDVTTAADGPTALDLAQYEPPDMILLDLTMPRMHGLEVTRRLKADERTGSVPVLIVTASDSPALLKAALAAGASGYCIKPCLSETLVQEVNRLLRS